MRILVFISCAVQMFATACSHSQTDQLAERVEVTRVHGSAQLSRVVETFRGGELVATHKRTTKDSLRMNWGEAVEYGDVVNVAYEASVALLRKELGLKVKNGMYEHLPGFLLKGPRNAVTGDVIMEFSRFTPAESDGRFDSAPAYRLGRSTLIYVRIKDSSAIPILIDSLFLSRPIEDSKEQMSAGLGNIAFDEHLPRINFSVDNRAFCYDMQTRITTRLEEFTYVIPVRGSSTYLGYTNSTQEYSLLSNANKLQKTLTGPEARWILAAFHLDENCFGIVITHRKRMDRTTSCYLLDFSTGGSGLIQEFGNDEILSMRLAN